METIVRQPQGDGLTSLQSNVGTGNCPFWGGYSFFAGGGLFSFVFFLKVLNTFVFSIFFLNYLIYDSNTKQHTKCNIQKIK